MGGRGRGQWWSARGLHTPRLAEVWPDLLDRALVVIGSFSRPIRLCSGGIAGVKRLQFHAQAMDWIGLRQSHTHGKDDRTEWENHARASLPCSVVAGTSGIPETGGGYRDGDGKTLKFFPFATYFSLTTSCQCHGSFDVSRAECDSCGFPSREERKDRRSVCVGESWNRSLSFIELLGCTGQSREETADEWPRASK